MHPGMHTYTMIERDPQTDRQTETYKRYIQRQRYIVRDREI